jgi:hypothetical protein
MQGYTLGSVLLSTEQLNVDLAFTRTSKSYSVARSATKFGARVSIDAAFENLR